MPVRPTITGWPLVIITAVLILAVAAASLRPAAAPPVDRTDLRWRMHRMGISRERPSAANSSASSDSKLPPADTGPSYSSSRALTGPTAQLRQERRARKERHDERYADYIKRLPRLQVALRKTANIECNLDRSLENIDYNLTWVKYNRSSASSDIYPDSQLVISLDKRIISPNKRYKVIKENSTVWHLRIDDLKEEDGEAMYLCQVHQQSGQQQPASGDHSVARSAGPGVSMPLYGFSRGALLHVMVTPIVIEQETSPSMVLANEYEPTSLRCKVWSPQRNYISWRREDGRPLHDTPEWLHVAAPSPRSPNWEGVSDSSTLRFEKFLREQAGVYLCVASNDVGGVQQRIELIALNCRQLEDREAPDEDCKAPRASAAQARAGPESQPAGQDAPIPLTSSTPKSKSRAQTTAPTNSSRPMNGWKTGAGKARQQQQQQQPTTTTTTSDKRPATYVLNAKAAEERHLWPEQERAEIVQYVRVAADSNGGQSALIGRAASSSGVLMAQTVGVSVLLMLLL